MKQAVKEVLAKPKAGQTPLAGLVVRPQALAAEDYAFGNQSVLSSRISETTLKRLRELSITTQEELLGYLEIPGRDLSAFATLLESSPQAIPQIQDYLKATLDPMIISRFDAVGRETYAFGAFLPPPGAETSAQARSEITEPADDSALLNRECLPTVKDQGNRGACVAFATCAVVEFAYCVHRGQALDLSEQFQFWHCKQHDRAPTSDGTWPHVSFALVGAHGICDDTEWNVRPGPDSWKHIA